MTPASAPTGSLKYNYAIKKPLSTMGAAFCFQSPVYCLIVGVLANHALADDAVISFPKVTTACCRETYA